MIKAISNNRGALSAVFIIFFAWALLGINTINFGQSYNKNASIDNQPPVALSTEIYTQINNPISIYLSSLTKNPNGDKIAHISIVDLPQHGQLSLYAANQNILFYNYPKSTEPENKKFNGNNIRVVYNPNQNYIGGDSFTYVAYGNDGNKSKKGKIKIETSKLPIIQKNVPPIADDFKFTINTKETLHIDLNSLTSDLNAEPLVLSTKPSMGNNFSFRNLNYGLIEGGTWFNYLPNKPGTEIIRYSVKDSINEMRFGNIAITIVQATSYSGDITSKITNLKDYLLSRTILKSYTVLMLIGWFVFLLFTILILFFRILPIKIFQYKKIFFIVGSLSLLISFFLFVLFMLGKKINLILIIFIIITLVSGLSLIYKKKLNSFADKFLIILKNNHIAFLLLILNSTILFYNSTNLTLPAIALDEAFLQYHYYFRDNIITLISPHHYTRILIPYLTSLIPVHDPNLAFKIIHTIFFNLLVLVLYKTWRSLKIKPYLFYAALFLLLCGPVRFYNFWATSIDAPMLFFNACFIYLILKNQYKWLVIITPVAYLQHEIFLLNLFVLLLYSFFQVSIKINVNQNKKNIGFILLSIALTFLVKLIPEFITPLSHSDFFTLKQRIGYSLRLLLNDRFLTQTVTVLILYFSVYGAMLLLIFRSTKIEAINNCIKIIIIFIISYISIVSVLFGVVNSRVIYMVYPFVMTLILYRINNMNPIIVVLSIIISIPLMRVTSFPYVDPVMIEHGDKDLISLIGIYMIISYALLIYLKESKFIFEFENYILLIFDKIKKQ